MVQIIEVELCHLHAEADEDLADKLKPIRLLVLELEGVQIFGLVDSPTLDSRVPVDSRVQ